MTGARLRALAGLAALTVGVAAPAAASPAAEPPLSIVVSVEARRLWLLRGPDTLLAAPAAVGKGTTLAYRGRRWTFDTPAGRRTVLGKQSDPVWTPPDWHYVEAAERSGYALRWLQRGDSVRLMGGAAVEVRGSEVGLTYPDGEFEPLPAGEEIVFDGTIHVPPLGTRQRRVPGELGRFKLDLGDGYLIHGTPDSESVGEPVTHGCIRLADEDLEALYRLVPVGTPVEIR